MSPTQSIRTGVPLPEGFKPCVRCKDTRRAITEIHGFWRLNELGPNEDMPKEPPHVGLKHWCDDGKPDDEWNDLKRYCHGHTCTTAHIELEADDHETLRLKWNARNTILSKPVPRLGVPVWMFLAAGLAGMLVDLYLNR